MSKTPRKIIRICTSGRENGSGSDRESLTDSRTAREGGWDTFSNFFGLKYDPSDRVIFLYLVALLLVVLSLFVINRLLRMPLGRAWEALREDEIACRSLGLSPRRIKLTAFTISAAFAGFAGTLFHTIRIVLLWKPLRCVHWILL